MKSKDFAPIILLAFVSGVVSFFVSNLVISSDDNRSQSVEVVNTISTELQRPPTEYFNDTSINPTQTITIGEDQSEQPFGSSEQ